jgi:cell division protein FtsB
MRRIVRNLGLLVVLSFLTFGVAAYLRSPGGIPAAIEKRDKVRSMEEENQRLREELDSHKELIRKLDTDQKFREKKVREIYSLQKRNEQTIIVPTPPPTPAR